MRTVQFGWCCTIQRMAHEFKITRWVEFADTDMAGMMHFSNFFRFMESTEHAFYRSLGFTIHTEQFGQTLGWPRVHAACEYKSPLYFGDNVEIHLLVREIKKKSIAYTFIFRKLNAKPVKEVARGELTVVCVANPGAEKTMKAVPIPKVINDKLEVASKELLG